MKIGDILKTILSAGGFFGGILLTIIAMVDGIPQPLPFAIGLLTAASWSTWSLIKRKKFNDELSLIKLAMRNNGQLTIAEAMIELEIPVRRIKRRLKNLENQGVLGFEITDSGEMVYSISNTIDLERKKLLEDYFTDQS